MTFTTTPPTKPGYFIARDKQGKYEILADVYKTANGKLAVNSNGYAHLLDDFVADYEWCRLVPAEEVEKWKANHDNQVTLRRMLMDRPDLKERAALVSKLADENARLKKEVTEAYFEAAVKSELQQDTIDFNWNRSRAKQVAEGTLK